MKRLNPKIGKPFETGDAREDGKVFYRYQKTGDIDLAQRWVTPNPKSDEPIKAGDIGKDGKVFCRYKKTRGENLQELWVTPEWLMKNSNT